MKKSVLFLEFLVLATLISMSMTCPVQAWMVSKNWINPVYRGYDYFLDATVVAYEEESTATLVVNVYNDLWETAYVTVRVKMDWEAKNWTSTEMDYEIPEDMSHVFQVNIDIPTTATASNLVRHSYTIYIDYEDDAGILLDYDENTYSDFAVYSTDQADAQALRKELEAWRYAYETPLFMPSEAKELWIKATVERNMANDAYEYGNFTDAKIHYGNALNFTKEALTSEVDKTSDFEDALLSLIDSAGTYLSMQGWGYIIAGVGFGIGFLLIGIGAVVYLVRKSRPPAKAKAKA